MVSSSENDDRVTIEYEAQENYHYLEEERKNEERERKSPALG